MQIIKLKGAISAAQTTVKKNEGEIKHSEKEARRLEAELKKSDNEFKRDKANLKKYEDQVAAAEAELGSLHYQEGSADKLEEEFQNLRHEAQAARRKVDQMSGRFHWLNFQYRDPETNFDRSKVKGVAAKLITVKDPRFYQALDTAGGGKVKKNIFSLSDPKLLCKKVCGFKTGRKLLWFRKITTIWECRQLCLKMDTFVRFLLNISSMPLYLLW